MAAVYRVLRLVLTSLVGIFWGGMVCLQILRLLVTKPRKVLSWKDRTDPPKCLADPVYGSHGYARVNGVRLHYMAAGGEGKPLLLLLHGFPEFWYSWRHQIKAFSADYRVVALDLRGYGESDKPGRVEDYRLDTLVEDVHQLIPALGYQKGHVIAHDWGGAIAWGLSARYPDVVHQTVILNCPHPGAMMTFMSSHWGQFLRSWYMFFINLPWLPEWFFSSGDKKMIDNIFRGQLMGAKAGTFTADDIEAFKFNFNKKRDFTGPMNYIRAALRYGRVKCLRTPIEDVAVLLLWGTRDGALGVELAEISRKHAKRFTLKFIEGASHWVQQEEPELVNKYIKEFLSAN